MMIGKEGLRVVEKAEYMGGETRREKLLALAEAEGGKYRTEEGYADSGMIETGIGSSPHT